MKTNRFELASLPIIIWMGILVGCPLLYVLVLSFLTRGPSGNVVFQFTLNNYARIADPLYIDIFATSMGIALFTSLITLAVGYPFAYFTAMLSKKWRFYVLLLVLVPFWTSSLLRTYGFIILLQREGPVNHLLMFFGLVDEPQKLLYTYGAVLFGMVYMLLPFMIIPVYNAVDKLDKSLLEASRDLGATKANTFLRITLPLTLHGVVGGVTLVFIPAVGLYFVADLLGGIDVMLLGNLVANQVGAARNWPFAAALSLVMVCFVLFFVWLYSLVSRFTNQKGGLLG